MLNITDTLQVWDISGRPLMTSLPPEAARPPHSASQIRSVVLYYPGETNKPTVEELWSHHTGIWDSSV